MDERPCILRNYALTKFKTGPARRHDILPYYRWPCSHCPC
jgi:hypothetical protein